LNNSKSIFKHEETKTLKLSLNALGNTFLQILVDLSSLENLNLALSQLTYNSFSVLSEILGTNKDLNTLDLSQNNFSLLN